MSRPANQMRTGGQNPQFILRDYGGMSNLPARENIADSDFWWLENVMPLAPGNLSPVDGCSSALVTVSAETGPPSYLETFNANNVQYVFAVWKNSGNGYVVNMGTFAATLIITGLTSGLTQATQWEDSGLLIIDPTGYWDWNVTTPATLTPQSGAISTVTLLSALVLVGGTALNYVGPTGGTGGQLQTLYEVTTVVLIGGGTGYVVGDTLSLTDGSPITPAVITVSAVSSGGVITGIVLTSGGSYPGPTTSTATPTGPVGNTTTTQGIGTGATFNVRMIAYASQILSQGHGYTSTTYKDTSSGGTTLDQFTVLGGATAGTTIATYAGRVFIGSGRTVSYTDVDSYTSFGGAGGQFTITDSYLQSSITALVNANNYLYIFGAASIDALSNVTVTAGVTSFTRLNVTTSIGTVAPDSIFSYYRGLVFFNPAGIFLLSGATPEKLSQPIQGMINQIQINLPIYGCQVVVEAELCAAMMFTFVDLFSTNTPFERTLFAIFFRGKWWAYSTGSLIPAAAVSFPIMALQAMFFFSGNSLYQAFATSEISDFIARSKLWDASAPLHEKQSINAAVAFTPANEPNLNAAFAIDTEYGTEPPIQLTYDTLTWINNLGQPLQWVNNYGVTLNWVDGPQGYFLWTSQVESGGSQYVGFTLTGDNQSIEQVRIAGVRGKQDRNYLE